MNHPPKHHRVHIARRVERAMQRALVSVPRDAPLPDVATVLEREAVSCAIVRDGERPVGVVSRTDLLRAASRESADRGGHLAPLPALPVGELCQRAPITVDVDDTVSHAAARMVAERIHRVFVQRDAAIVGVFSTREVLEAIVAARVPTPVGDVMSHPLYTIAADATVAHATERLAQAHVSGLTVVDEVGWPVGFFSQTEALAARGWPAETPLEDAMNYALVCLHEGGELRRAAALAHAASARRVLVIRDRRAVGVLSPLDFARAVSA